MKYIGVLYVKLTIVMSFKTNRYSHVSYWLQSVLLVFQEVY